MIKTIKLLLLVSLFFVKQAYAVCVMNNGVTPINLYIDMGRVIVNPNLSTGAVIAEQNWNVGRVERAFYCSSKGDSLDGEVLMDNLLSQNGTIFQTNVPGVGIQFKRGSNIFPYTYRNPSDNYDISFSGGTFTVILYKTSEYVGSGPIAAGAYTTYGIKGNRSASIFNTFMSANGTSIVSPSCSVSGGSEQNVYLNPINITQLKTVGATGGETPFSLQLKCSGGASVNTGYDNVNLTFSGNIPQGMNSTNGVLANSKTSSDAASGIGIQVLDSSKQPLVFDKKYTVGTLANNSSSYIVTSDYIARYYRYADKVTPGEIESKMIFNIAYD